MRTKQTQGPFTTFAVRLDSSFQERIAGELQRLKADYYPARLTKSDALRIVLERGLDAGSKKAG